MYANLVYQLQKLQAQMHSVCGYKILMPFDESAQCLSSRMQQSHWSDCRFDTLCVCTVLGDYLKEEICGSLLLIMSGLFWSGASDFFMLLSTHCTWKQLDDLLCERWNGSFTVVERARTWCDVSSIS